MIPLLPALLASVAPCDLAVVGAGPGGAYVAWRYALARPSSTVCIFEQNTRVGGRVHSMRGQGPKEDLVVEAGAYRFATNETCIHFKNLSMCIYTPILKHLILDALKLPTKAYDPVVGAWDHVLHVITDSHGHDAGYKTFVEAMVQHSPPPNLHLRFAHQLVNVSLPADGEAAPKHGSEADAHDAAAMLLHFGNGAVFGAARLVLNIPQRPLLRLLGGSPALAPMSMPWPAPLTYPHAYPIVKVYVHYDDAWWLNDLKLAAGMFNNSDAWRTAAGGIFAAEDCLAARQAPFPLQGSYHDGDTRCDLPGERPCRGFLQAAYMGDPQVVRLFEEFHLNGNDSATVLEPAARPDHKYALESVHAALLALHKPQLDKVAGAYARVAAMRPSGGIISAWSMRAAGIETGCHYPRSGPPLSKKALPKAALQPLVGGPLEQKVLVVNEAFGTLECWAEGSLAMAENAAKRLGLAKPSWLPEDVYEQILFDKDSSKAADEAAAPTNKVHVSDLAMVEAAHKAGAHPRAAAATTVRRPSP